jgi:importin subunit beta-1
MSPEQVEPAVVGQILSTVVDGMRADRPDEVRLAGTTALLNSLDFAATNFDNAAERDMIMRTVCEATQAKDVKIREKAFECIVRIADIYYEKLQQYVDTLFQLTTTAIQTDDPLVGMQAIEFWSTVCDCESAALDEISEGVEDVIHHKLIEQAAPLLVPIMLETLTKQQEDVDGDDSWNIAMAGTHTTNYEHNN